MRHLKYISWLAAAVAGSLQPVAAAVDSPVDNGFDSATTKVEQVLGLFDERFAVMDSLVFGQPVTQDVGAELDAEAMVMLANKRADEIDDAVEAQISAMKARTGLELRGQIYGRPGRQISYDPDDPLVAYNAKFQAELNWDIFHSSIYKRASRIGELRLQGELRQLEYEREALSKTVFLQNSLMRNRHYGRLLSVLEEHARNLSVLMQTQMFLLQNGKISSDDLLKVINEQSELERQMVVIRSDSTIKPLPVTVAAVCVTVADSSALMSCIRDQHIDLRRLMLRQELLDAQRANTDYAQTMNIQPFARYSYYNRYHTHNTYNIDVGVSFNLPLTAEMQRKKRVLLAEKSVVAEEYGRTGEIIERDVTLLLLELNSHNENICAEYERMKSLKRYLRMRIESYDNVEGEYSRIDRLQEYNAYLQAWERLLGYVWQRDGILMKLQSCVPEEPISRFLVFTELN